MQQGACFAQGVKLMAKLPVTVPNREVDTQLTPRRTHMSAYCTHLPSSCCLQSFMPAAATGCGLAANMLSRVASMCSNRAC